MNQATYSVQEFFYNQKFDDYVLYSGIPYLSKETNEPNQLAIKLATLDTTGDGIFFNQDQLEKYLFDLKKYEEFKNCEIVLIDRPIVEYTAINRETFSLESEFYPISSFMVSFNEDFIGESFSFQGIFYLYSIQFFYENNQYNLVFRGFEKF